MADNEFILGNVVPQVGNQVTSQPNQPGTFIEIVKGPTSLFDDFLRNYPLGTKRSVIQTAFNISTDNVPNALSGQEWYLSGYTLTKGESGVHANVQFTWNAGKETQGELSTSTFTWSMDWEPYTLNVLAFCKNQYHEEHTFVKNPSYGDETAYAPYIKSYIDSANKSQLSSLNYFTYKKQGQGGVYQLNQAETAIAKKIAAGVEFVEYHRPVLTKTTRSPALSGNQTIDSIDGFQNIAGDIDSIVDHNTLNIPFTIEPPIGHENGWKLIKTVDNLEVSVNPNAMTSAWTRIERWVGATEWDENLYGKENPGDLSGRWLVGEM